MYDLLFNDHRTKNDHKFAVQRVQLSLVKGNVSLKDNIMNSNIKNNNNRCQLSAPLEMKNSNAIII